MAYQQSSLQNVTRIAFVGSSEKWWMGYQREAVVKRIIYILEEHTEYKISETHDTYTDLSTVMMVSGGCPYGGVDIWAEVIADTLGYPKTIYEPRASGWKYYKERNIKIAEGCDILYCFEPEWDIHMDVRKKYRVGNKFCRRSGGIWTYEYARDVCNQEVHLEMIEI